MGRQDMLGFSFNGIKSSDVGVRLMRYPDLTQPERRGMELEVPGRNDTLWLDEGGYGAVDLKLACETKNGADRLAIAQWLTGAGKLILLQSPNYCLRARVIKGYEFSRVLSGSDIARFEIVFSCQPCWYESKPTVLALSTPRSLINPGTLASEPLIEIEGSGEIVLSVGEDQWTITNLEAGSIVIDSEMRTAYSRDSDGNPSVLLTGILSGSGWPVLQPGSTPVSWSGSVTRVSIVGNWRWI